MTKRTLTAAYAARRRTTSRSALASLLCLILAFSALIGCTEAADEAPWRIDSVRSATGGTPVGILALGTTVNVGDSGIEFRLGGASISRDAEVTETANGATIELDVNGKAVEIEFERLDPERAELRWMAGGRVVVAEMSRGGNQ